jgi:hypothetical protein
MEVRTMLRKMSLLLLAAGLLAVSLAAAPAPDGYTIKLKKSGKDSVTTHKKQDIEKSDFKLEDPDGKILKQDKKSQVVTEEYKETIVEKEKGKRPTKLRREYTKAAVTINDKETTLPYDGKTVVIEKKDGKYHFTIEGGAELSGKDAEYLNRSFNKKDADDSDEDSLEKAFLPNKPIEVNGTWKVDTKEVLKSLQKTSPLPVDKDKATGEGKLLRAYKKDRRQFGVFEIKVNLPLKGEFPLGNNLSAPIQDGSKMTFTVKGDACIDGTSSDSQGNMNMDINMVATFKGPDGKEYKMTLKAANKSEETEKDLSKK